MPLAVQASQKDAFAWDVRVSEAIHAYENRRTILNSEVDVLGVVLRPPVQLLGLLIVIAVLLAMVARGRPRSALFIALGVGGAAVLGLALKGVFERPPVDPSGHGYSFPSGHAMRSMAAASALTVVAWPSRWRWPAALGGMIAAALTGVAVVYHEWHWVSDVFAGWCVSVAWLGLVWLALRPAK